MQTGAQIVSVRGEGPWSGMTTLTTSERGDRRLAKLENCYVNVDGSEIRTFPGMRCVVDLQTTPESRETGYRRNFVDAMRPDYTASGTSKYLTAVASSVVAEADKLYCWTNPTRFHSFHFVRGRPIILGESDFRKEPIFSSDGVQRTVSEIAKSGSDTVLTLSGSYRSDDWSFNGIGRERATLTDATFGVPSGRGAWIYLENIPAIANSTAQADLNNKFHCVKSQTGNTVMLFTTVTTLAAPATGLTADIYRCRPGTAQYRTSQTTGVSYYDTDSNFKPVESYAVDDPEALTSWMLTDRPNLTAPVKDSWQANVANRIRDFGGVGKLVTTTGTATNDGSYGVLTPADINRFPAGAFSQYDYHYYVKLTISGNTQIRQVISTDNDDITGTVSTSTTTTINVTGTPWTGLNLVDRVVETNNGFSRIVANTSSQISFNPAISPAPTGSFTIHGNKGKIFVYPTWGTTGTGDVEILSYGRQEGGERAVGAVGTDSGPYSFSRRRQKRIPYRPVPTISGDRLLIAAPGYGCVFQSPAVYPIDPTLASQEDGQPSFTNDRDNIIRCVGVPKAILQCDLRNKDLATKVESLNLSRNVAIKGLSAKEYSYNTIHTGNNYAGATRGGDYAFAVAYKDEATGEVGLLSEACVVETPNTGEWGVTLRVLYPGYLMAECAAYTLLVYRSTKDDTQSLYFMGEYSYGRQQESFEPNLFGIHGPYYELGLDQLGNEMAEALGDTASWTVLGTNTKSGSGGEVTITYSNNSEGATAALSQVGALNSDLIIDRWYKITGEAKVNTGSVNIAVNTGSTIQGPTITSTSYVPWTMYFKATSATTNTLRFANMGAGEAITVRNISVKLINEDCAKYESNGKYGLSIAWPTPDSTLNSTERYDDDAPAVFATIHNIQFIDDAELTLNATAPPVLNQMPRGAKAVRTIRGWTFYGGSQGNCGENGEMLAVDIVSAYDSESYPTPAQRQFDWLYQDEIATKPWPSPVINSQYRLPTSANSSDAYLCAQDIIPPSYAGLDFLTPGMFPYPAKTSKLDRLVNIDIVSSPAIGIQPPRAEGAAHAWPRWKITNSPFLSHQESYERTGKMYLKMPRGRFQVSEQGFPSITPATSTGFLDNENDDDIEAIGQYGGQAILCSRLRTYTVGWSGSPITDVGVTPPEIASPEFGCIAANTMVEFDGGLAWISDRGPVSMTGEGVQWIGRELAADFFGETAKYKRDSKGMMRHAWACHDPERGLVYFGLFSNRNKSMGYKTLNISFRGTTVEWDTASDEAKSFFPCDEVLVWSYRSNAWSVYYPPTRIHPEASTYFGSTEILWMARGPDSTGTQRVYAMQADGRIYALIDENNDSNVDGLTLIINAAGTATVNGTLEAVVEFDPGTGSPGQTYAKWASNEHLRAGMEAYITDSTGTILKGRAAVRTWNLGNHEITLWAPGADQGVFSWVSGDRLVLGARTMRMTTNYLNMKGHSDRASVRRIGVRYSLRSKLTTIGTGTQLPAFARATAKVNKRSSVGTSTPTPTNDVSLSAVASVDTFDYLGKSYADGSSRDYGFTRALPVGQEFSLTIETVGTAQVAVQDLYAEVS